MSVRIVRTPEAKGDLFDIWAFAEAEFGANVADTTLARLYGAMEVLAEAPRAGRIRHEFDGAPRSFAVPPFVIFYEPLEDGNGIVVWRILHGARDLPAMIRKPDQA